MADIYDAVRQEFVKRGCYLLRDDEREKAWWIFQDPRGIMRFYTPYVGYNYCRWWLIILIWMAYIFDFWPFKRGWVRNAHPLQKGIVLSLVSVGVNLWSSS